MRTAIVDIETTDLAACGAGVLLLACVKPIDEAAQTLRIDNYRNCRPGHEKAIVKALIDACGQYEFLVGHNFEGFDWPFLRTRALVLGLAIPRPFPFFYDTMRGFGRTKFRTVLTRFGKPTKSLAMIADLLGIQQKKTKIYPQRHWQGVWGNKAERKAALDELEEHCIADVELNEDVYKVVVREDPNPIIRRLK